MKFSLALSLIVFLAIRVDRCLADNLIDGDVDATDVCIDVEDRRNQKDLYSHPDDCHAYVQCYYSGNAEALGYDRRCQPNYFFDEATLACVEEGPVPCTRLHELPSQRGRVSETTCRDAFGNMLHAVDDDVTVFKLGDTTLPCPENRQFDLDICQCKLPSSLLSSADLRRCQLWLPLDEDLQDHSFEKFQTFPSGDTVLDHESLFNGDASLHLNHGRLRIQGLRGFDLPSIGQPRSASWCLAFRCQSGDSHNCLHEGALLSNARDTSLNDLTFAMAVRPNNKLEIRLGTKPVTSAMVPVNWQFAGWNHVCVVVDKGQMRVYLNSKVAAEQSLQGNFTESLNAYSVGSDAVAGNFIGHIDDVLACSFPITETDVNALYNGDHDTLRRQGIFP